MLQLKLTLQLWQRVDVALLHLCPSRDGLKLIAVVYVYKVLSLLYLFGFYRNEPRIWRLFLLEEIHWCVLLVFFVLGAVDVRQSRLKLNWHILGVFETLLRNSYQVPRSLCFPGHRYVKGPICSSTS